MNTPNGSSDGREWSPGGSRGRYGKLGAIAGAVVVVGAAVWAVFDLHAPASDQPPPAKLASDNAGTPNAGAPDASAAQPGATPAATPAAAAQSADAQSAYTPSAPTVAQQPGASAPAAASAPSGQSGGDNAQAAQDSKPAQGAQPAAQAAASTEQPAAPSGAGSASDQSAAAAPAPAAASGPDQSVASADNAAPAATPAHKAKHHAAAAADKAADKTETAVAAPVPPVAPASDALKQWWATGGDDSAFKVKAVGQGADANSVVLVFSQPVDPSAAGQHLRLLNEQGGQVGGSWQQGGNSYVLTLPGLQAGRYLLFIDQAIASTSGQALGAEVQGPVYISQRVAQADSGTGG